MVWWNARDLLLLRLSFATTTELSWPSVRFVLNFKIILVYQFHTLNVNHCVVGKNLQEIGSVVKKRIGRPRSARIPEHINALFVHLNFAVSTTWGCKHAAALQLYNRSVHPIQPLAIIFMGLFEG